MLSGLCYFSQGGNSAQSRDEIKPLRAYIQGHYKKRQYFLLWELQQKGKKKREDMYLNKLSLFNSEQAVVISVYTWDRVCFYFYNNISFLFDFFKSKTFRKQINSLHMNDIYFCYWGTCNPMSRPCLYQVLTSCIHFATEVSVRTEKRSYGLTDL